MNPQKTTLCPGTFTESVPGILLFFVFYLIFSGSIIRTSAQTRNPHDGDQPAITYNLSGNVFEDINYGGGAGRSKATCSGISRSNARVEIYNASGVFQSFATTDVNGDYSFTGLDAGDYHIRVVNASVTSSRSGYTTSCLPVQTYRTDATSGTAMEVSDYVGGTDPTVADPGNGSSGTTFNTSTFVFTAILTGTAQSVTIVVIGSADITGIDFGFSFNTIVNINNTGQGSLRQFITNANTLGNTGLALTGQPAGQDVSIFMISDGNAHPGLRTGLTNQLSNGVATITLTTALPDITASSTSLNGTTQTTNVGNTNAGEVGTGGTVGVDAVSLPQYPRPEVAINASWTGSRYAALTLSGTVSDILLQGFAMYNGRHLITITSGNGTNRVIRNMLVGTLPDGADPGSLRNNGMGVRVTSVSSCTVDQCYVGWNGESGILGTSTASVMTVTYCEAFGNGWNSNGHDGIDIDGINSTIQYNLSHNNTNNTGTPQPGAGNGIECGSSGLGGSNNTLVENNTSRNNTTSGLTIRAGVNNITVRKNIFSYNPVGILVSRESANTNNHFITMNSTFANTNLGIDLVLSASTGDGITPNNGTKDVSYPNYDMDFPVFTSAGISGTTLTVAGYVGSAPGQSTFGNARVEIFKSDDHASGNGEGKNYLGYLTTDANGNLSGSISVSGWIDGDKITGTASDGSGNTSEFGPNFTVFICPVTPGAITGTTAQCPALTGQVYSISSVPGATTYNWTVPTGWSITGGQAATSVTVTTGSAGQNGNISVTAGNTCGTSPESSLAVTVVAVPTITGTTPGSRCGTGTVGLGASASAGIINWYSASTGGSSLGTGISFTTPSILTTTTYYVDATANGCTTASRTAVTATVSNIPVAPTLSVASPTTGSSICAGYNSGTVTGNAGTGGGTGAVDEYQVSINGGSSYSAYTSGNAINTSGAAGSVIVQSRRTGGTGTNCTTTAWSTICTWTIASAPTAPTLSAANPTNGSTICSGFNIGTVTGTGGSGGSTGAANEYQVSINGGSTYSAYTSGSAINTSSATGSVIVQSRRTAGSYGCTASSWSTICTWTANAVEVNATVGGSACYATLLAAFAAINLGTHQDVITININGNTTEAASAVINASGTGGASYSSITIQPNGGACIVSGNIAGALIDLNGANNVTIDGLNSGGNSLAIRNTNTSGTASTIRFIADASNNTITNCTIEGSGTGPAYGTIFFSAGTTTGNDNNTVSLNTIKPAGSNLHLNAIYSAGSSGVTDNSGITISGNNIQDYFNAGTNGSSGILVFSNSSDWNITGNRFFQTSPRACSAALTHRAIAVLTGQGYVITDNIIGFINSGGTGKTTYTGSYGYMFRGIELTVGTGEVTSVQGNTVSGISIASSTAIALPGAFSGITILAGAVDIGGINGNTIGGAMGTDAIAVTSATTLTNISGIYSTTTSNVSIQNNIIGAINTGTGVAAIGYIFYGIYSAGTGSYTISSNTIGSTGTANAIAIGTLTVTTSGVCTFNGINNAATGTISITGNTIQNCTAYGTGASVFNGILNSAAGSSTTLDVTQNNIIAINNTGTGASTGISVTAATAAVLNITGNRILSCSITGTTGFTAISNVSAVAATTISENTIRNIVRSTTTGAVTGISSTGAVTAFLNINDNQFGNGDGGLVTYTAANSSALAGITVTTATANCELYIQRNDFRGIIHNVQGSSAHTYIINAATTKKQEIINNTFTDLEVNTTGAVIFISNSVVLPANATQTVSENKIVTATIPAPEFYFKKTGAGGTVTLFTSTAATTAAGVAVNHINNDFSKISITGATTMAGWVHTDAGGQSVKTFTGNSFSNWTGGSSAITVLTVSGGANGSGVVSGNTMSNISGGAAITGIVTGSGNEIFSSNTINDLTSSGAAAVTGISVTAGTYRKISRNKIYNLTASITGGTVNGILVSGTTTGIQVQIDNNLIGDLSTPNSSAVDPVRAISVTNTGTNSSIYVYYNTIYLNSASTGANFGSTGVYHTVSATATTAALTLRNNIIINQSVPSGTGITAAYRRSGTSLNNFTLASNNNLFHAGAPSSTRLVFYDGTNSAQTLGEYQAMVGPTRETFSVYEDLISGSKFKSVIGANGTYLHLDPLKSTLAFNSAVNISGITEDFDGAIRQGNPGYFGDETAPDIGADEVNTGFQPSALSGVYNVGTGQLFTSLTNDGGLFATINSLGLGGNVTVNITSDLIEDGNNPLNQWNETGTGNYTLTIIPGAAVQRLVSCNLNNGFIRFNGADRVTIDGSFNGSGNYLIFRNTNTNSSASVFLFANDASGNTVKNSTMEGSCIGTTSGIVIFSTGTSTGNDDNTISNNIIRPAGVNLPTNAIYSAGSSIFIDNSNNAITGNSIQDYYNASTASNGIFIASNCSGWTISGNKLFQSATRTATAANIHRGINIVTALGVGYTVSNNIIGYANASQTGTSTYTCGASMSNRYFGIELTVGTSAVSNVQGNTIAGISLTNTIGTAVTAAPGIFTGISILAGSVNVGETTEGTFGNTIGATTGNGSITVTGSVTLNYIAGIYVTSAGTVNIQNNNIGAFRTAGGNTIGYTFHAINTAGTGGFNISSNNIGSAGTANSISVGTVSTTSGVCTLNGIYNLATGVVSISGNTVQNVTVYGTGASILIGVQNSTGSGNELAITGNSIIAINNTGSGAITGISNTAAIAATANITTNTIRSSTLSGTGAFTGIVNSSIAATININNNIIRNITRTPVTGAFTGISSTGAVPTALNINDNQLGNADGGLVTFSAASSGALTGINVSGAIATCDVSIQRNDFSGIVHSSVATSPHTYIINAAVSQSMTISSNTFTNLNVNTTGAIIFISNNVSLLSGSTKNINNNSIVNGFTRTSTAASGTLTLYTNTTGVSAPGSTINNNNNDFSNITVSGAAIIAGWINTDAGYGTKNLKNNTFSNWTGANTPTGAFTGIAVNTIGTDNEVSGNQINTFYAGGNIYGITTAAGNDRISSNTIHTLVSISATAAAVVNGIAITAGTLKQVFQNTIYNLESNGGFTTGSISGIAVTGGLTNLVYRNKIYNISSANSAITTGTVNGIMVSGTGADQVTTVRNNIIGDIRATAASAADPMRGINIANTGLRSATNVYFNTVYLNAGQSTGTNCGSSGIYHAASATATTGRLDLRNNVIVNISQPKGTGLTVAFRRSAGTANTQNNFAVTSNNNLYYAGTPGATNLIYYDLTAPGTFQTLTAYKAATFTAGTISPRDQASITENPDFVSTTGGDATYLHINTATATQIESGAANIAGISVDFDGDTRQGNTGYSGSGTMPDIGADEGNFTKNDLVGPTISYTPIANNSCTGNPTLSVVITDASGINTTTGTKPRIYFKKSTSNNAINGNTSSDNGWKYTEATNTASPFNFEINFSILLGGSANTGDIIQYFVVAQDLAATPNVSMNAGAFTTPPGSVALITSNVPTANTPASFTILAGLSGNVTIGSAGTYTSLTGAGGLFSDINIKGLSGNLTATIIDGSVTETGANALNTVRYGCNNNYTIIVNPNAATAVTLTGSVAGPLINLNGAGNVTIDGLNTGGASLTISNTNSTGTASTIQFIADASNNTITNCIIEGSGTGAAYGTILFSTGTITGNDANTISYNTIRPAGSNLPTNAIYSAGTSIVADNSGNSIINNSIQDYFNAAAASNGIFIASNSSAWTINGNKFFQTGDRTATAGATHRAINIVTASGTGYTVNNNIIGFADASSTGTTSYGGTFANLFRAIEMTVNIIGTASVADGNTIGGINFTTSSGTSTLPGIFSGISVLAGNVNIGTVTGNTIGSTTGTGSITVTSSTSLGVVTGIYSTTLGTVSISKNNIGSITAVGTGNVGYTFYGINSAGVLGNYNISSNTVGGATSNSISIGTGSAAAVTTLYGIYNLATGVISISDNAVQNATANGTGASLLTGILNSAGSGTELNLTGNSVIAINNTGTGAVTGISNTAATAAAANITGNTVRSSTFTGTGAFTGILNGSTAATTNINTNIIRNISSGGPAVTVTGISSTGAIPTALNINSNQLGNSDGGFITFSAANSGAVTGITVATTAATAALSIQSNNFSGIVHSSLGTSTHTYIINAAATKSQNISYNTFTNLNVNTTGAIIFIQNNVSLPNGGTQDINNNSIVTGFTRASTAASGALTIFTSSTSVSAAGSTINNNGNNFSNITVSGAASIAGWINTDAGNGTKNIKNNTFSTWTGANTPTGAFTGITVNTVGTDNEISGNQVNTFIGGGNIYGITTAAGNDRISLNTIHTLVSSSATAAAVVNGIAITSGTLKQVFQNTIYNLQSNGGFTTGSISGIAVTGGLSSLIVRNRIYNISSAGSAITTGTVNGIMVSGAVADQSTTIRNNIIGDIRAAAAAAADPMRGINIANTGLRSSTNVYYNTVYMNAPASSGVNCGSSGLYHAANAIATTGALDLRNNIILNQSTPKGTGLTVAVRRSASATNNYLLTSNNNLFYAGAPSSNQLVYYDGTNSALALTDYQAIVTPREINSVYEDLISGTKFLSTDGGNANFLHLDPAKENLAESRAVNIDGITLDYDSDIRQGNPGYTGFGEAPDIGADEFNGSPALALSGSYKVGLGERFTSFTNAGGLFATINSLGLKGNVTVNVTSDLSEGGSRSLNQWTEEGAGNYTLTIRPSAASPRIISGNVDAGMIRYTGGDRVLIDGRFSGAGSYLTFRNTSTVSGTSTFQFINDASDNTIKNCIIEGSGTGTTSGTVFLSAGTVTGNDNITITTNTIGPAGSNLPANAIYSAGSSVSIDNSEITVSDNLIKDYFSASASSNGIFAASNSAAWTITGNKLFQTATRTVTAGNIHRGINIVTPSGVGYTVNNNIVGFANAASTGTTTYTGGFATIFRGIEMTVGITGTSGIQGNTIGGIYLATSSAAALPGIFSGISVLSGNVNIGTSTANTVGASTGTGSIVVNSTTTGGVVTGIYVTTIGSADIRNNTVGSVTATGDDAIGFTFHGIYSAGAFGNCNIISNTIGSAVTANSISVGSNTATAVNAFNGINNAATGTVSINDNVVRNATVNGSAASVLYGILNSGAGGALSINGNNIISCTNMGTGTGAFTAISNTAAPETATINSNIIRNNLRTASGVFTGISSTGAIYSALNVDNNHLGNADGGLLVNSAASSGALTGINVSGATGSSALSIQGNDIRGITYSVASTSANTYIINTAATKSQNISNNTFTDLDVNTSGNVIFISNNVVLPVDGTQLIQNNRLATAIMPVPAIFFNKGISGGTLTLFTSTTTATAAQGVTITHSNNNFSNLQVTGSTAIAGWVQTDAGEGSPTLALRNNTFENWQGGSGAITVINVNTTSTSNATKENSIKKISSSGSITGIITGAGNDNIFSNTIDSLISEGGVAATIVSGINITSGSYQNIYSNIISHLTGNGPTTGTVRGMLISGGSLINVYQNTISGLTSNSNTTGAISGIWISGGSFINVDRNKIYDISSGSSAMSGAGSVQGIHVSGSSANLNVTISNNIIGDIRTLNANLANPLRGISLISTGLNSNLNIYYNTVYLNATSTRTNFGTSGIHHVSSSTAATATLDLRNNIIINNSESFGTGLTVAFRRSAPDLANYALTSSNNLYYAGPTSAPGLIYHDGTNSDQSLEAFQARVTPADAASVTEDIATNMGFLSLMGTAQDYLHINPAKPTLIESGAGVIAGFAVDFDGEPRNELAPDIGADESAGLRPVVIVSAAHAGSNGNYLSLGVAFDSINAQEQTGNDIVLKVIANSLEGTTASLNPGSWNSLTVYPTAEGIYIYGNIDGASLVDLNGADHVTFDGRVNKTGSAKDLTLANTYTGAAASTIRFFGSAENNTVKYCTVKGAGTGQTGGVIFFSTALSGNGNNGNMIDHCDLTSDGSNRPYNIVYSSGTSGSENSANTISNNNIFDFINAGASSNGIYIGSNSTGWTITGNSFYETTSFTPNTFAEYDVIRIDNTSGDSFTVSDNYIGGSSASCGGGAWTVTSANYNTFSGIRMTVGNSPTSSVQNNTIQNMNYTSDGFWYGIYLDAGSINIGTIAGNTIGATSGNSSITVSKNYNYSSAYGIFVNGSGTVNIENNNIGSITTTGNESYPLSFFGIFNSSTGETGRIVGNLIGSIYTANSIQATGSASSSGTPQYVSGIYCAATGSTLISGNTIVNMYNAYAKPTSEYGNIEGIVTTNGVNTILNNTIQNLNTTSPGTGTDDAASVLGISQTSTSPGQIVSGNEIYNLSNTYGSAINVSVIGLFYAGPASGTNTVSGNFIHGLSLSPGSTSGLIAGIKTGSGTTTYSNNIISLGGNTATTVYGIYETGEYNTNNNLYFNTVYIEGNLSSGITDKSYALFSNTKSNVRNFRNNVLANFRSTTNGSNLHYAAYFNYTGSGNLILDYNDYFAPGEGGVVGYYGGSSKTSLPIVPGTDGHSTISDPQFVYAGGPEASHYRLNAPTEGTGTTGIWIDYGMVARGTPPNIGAWELITNRWIGTVSSDFGNYLNWTSETVPVAGANIVFDIDAVNDCYLDIDRTVGNITNHTGKLFVVNEKQLTIQGNPYLSIEAKIDATAASSTVVFAGTKVQTIPAETFVSNAVYNLTVNTDYGVTSLADLAVTNNLSLLSTNPSANAGSLDMRDTSALKILTMGANATTTGIGDVTGIVKRSSFDADTPYSFGNEFTTLTFSEGGTMPDDISVKISIGEAPPAKPDAILRNYDIVRTGGSNLEVSLAQHYLDSELNGIPEADLIVVSGQTGNLIVNELGKTADNATDNWVSLSNLNITDFLTAPGNKFWTLARAYSSVVISGNKGWRMISSPRATTCADLLFGFTSQGVTGSTYPAKQPNFLWFDETDTLTTNMSWRTASSMNDAIKSGRGYYFYVFGAIEEDPDYNLPLPAVMSASGNQDFTSGEYSFSGPNQRVTFSPRAGGQSGTGSFYDTNLDDEGWNMVGNPSTLSLDWDHPTGWTKTNLDNAIYIWDPAANDWKTWNGTTGTLGTGKIAPFQAFWVKASATDPALDFTDAVLTTGGYFYGGGSPVKSTTTPSQPLTVNLSLKAMDMKTSAFLTFSPDAAIGHDPRDAFRLEPLSDTWLELFSVASPLHTEPLVINNLPPPDQDVYNLPLFTGGQVKGQPLNGAYTMEWQLPADWPADWCISLHDHGLKKALSMNEQHQYDFSQGSTKQGALSQPGEDKQPVLPPSIVKPVSSQSSLKAGGEPPPFSIIIERRSPGQTVNYIALKPRLLPNYPNPFNRSTTIRFSLPAPGKVTLSLYNIYGQLIQVIDHQNFEAGMHELTWQRSSLKCGIYLLQMKTAENTEVIKLNIVN